MRGGTGLLTRDVLPRICTFPPYWAVVCRRPCIRRSQLRGSGGVSPRFPFIPPVASFLWRSIRSSKLDSFLRRDALFEGVFQQAHLRGQIRNLQDFWFSIAPRQDDVTHVGFGFQEVDDLFGGEKSVAQRVVDLVQDHNVVIPRGDLLDGGLPGGAHHGFINLNVLTFPGETLAHRVDFKAAKPGRAAQLTALPFPFEELQHDHAHAVATGPKGNSQGRRGFSFAVTGVDDNEAFLLVGGRCRPGDGFFHGVLSSLSGKSDGWSTLASPSRA